MTDYSSHPVAQRLYATGPKRILSLDGGGIRGAVTLGYLKKLEAELRRRHNRPDMVLSDYFDLIGGTSTGSIIAASLAIGMDIASILKGYGEMGSTIFEPPAKWWQFGKLLRQNLFYKNRPAAIEGTLQKYFHNQETNTEILLGGKELKCGLVIVAKRVDTFSVWPMHNNPKGKYYDQNKDIPLWRVVRASSAAPTFFPPTIFQYDQKGSKGAFIDGGVSTFNNPAMLLFLISTLKGFKLEWPTGPDQLLLVSIGTGTTDIRYTADEVQELGEKNALFWGQTVPNLFMRDGSDYNELLLQNLSNSPTARKIDSEVGTLGEDLFGGQASLHYLRYQATITDADISENKKYTAKNPEAFPKVDTLDEMMKMDRGVNVFHLAEIGKRYGEEALAEKVFEEHFLKGFDV